MAKNYKIDNNEINVSDLLFTVWKGKWKVAVAVVISLITAILYQSNQTHNFTARTEIKPISDLNYNKFYVFNNLVTKVNNRKIEVNISNNREIEVNDLDTNLDYYVPGKFSRITSLRLLSLYLNVLNNRSVFEDGIRKFNLLEAGQYNNEQEYGEAISRLASKIKILSPSVGGKKKKGNLETSYYTINFTYSDVEKWKNVLMYADEIANKLVKKILVEEYNNNLLFLEEVQKFQLEDILIEISNFYTDYDREISDRMVFLKEQAEIARELGIAKNTIDTIEVKKFGNQNAYLSNIQAVSPFYFRGQEAIDKEVELIELRSDKKAFIKGLFELEKKKRQIEQDQTIVRIKSILQLDILEDNKIFSAASINAVTTKFKYEDKRKIPMLAIVIGLLVGVSYVIISKTFQPYRVIRKKTD